MKFDAKRIFKRFKGSEGSEGKVLKMDRPAAGGFLSLTGLWPEGCGGGFAAIFKGGAANAAGCVEGLCSLRSGGDSACGAEGGGLPYGQCL